jgi:protein TonB
MKYISAVCFAVATLWAATSTVQSSSRVPERSDRALAILAPAPKYKREWAEQGIVGEGVAELSVNPADGTVTRAHMVKSTGHKVLDDSALEAFRRWRFKPGTKSKVKIPINFINYPFEHWFIQKHGYPPPKSPKT